MAHIWSLVSCTLVASSVTSLENASLFNVIEVVYEFLFDALGAPNLTRRLFRTNNHCGGCPANTLRNLAVLVGRRFREEVALLARVVCEAGMAHSCYTVSATVVGAVGEAGTLSAFALFQLRAQWTAK